MNNISTRNKIIIFIVYTVGVAATAVYLVPIKTKEVVKTVTQDKIVYQDRIVKSDDKRGTITKHKEKKPDGTVVTDTKIVYDDSNKQTETKDGTVDKTTSTDKEKETQRGDSKVTIMGLAGYDILKGQVVYGASVSKPILGPLTIGAFGLSNATAGVGVGVTF